MFVLTTKYNAMRGYGLQIAERVPLEMPAGEHNHDYLRTKRDKMGHDLGAGRQAPQGRPDPARGRGRLLTQVCKPLI